MQTTEGDLITGGRIEDRSVASSDGVYEKTNADSAEASALK
jgi:hypothetical protein